MYNYTDTQYYKNLLQYEMYMCTLYRAHYEEFKWIALIELSKLQVINDKK